MPTIARIALQGDVDVQRIPDLVREFRAVSYPDRLIVNCSQLGQVCPEFYRFLVGQIRTTDPPNVIVLSGIPPVVYEELGKHRAHRLFEIDTSHLDSELVERCQQDTSPELNTRGVTFVQVTRSKGVCRIAIRLAPGPVDSGALAFALMPTDSLAPPEEIYQRIIIDRSSRTVLTEDAKLFLQELAHKIGERLMFEHYPEPMPAKKGGVDFDSPKPVESKPSSKPAKMSKCEAGRRGGEVTSQRYGPQFYEEIGRKGGQRTKALIEQGKRREARDS